MNGNEPVYMKLKNDILKRDVVSSEKVIDACKTLKRNSSKKRRQRKSNQPNLKLDENPHKVEKSDLKSDIDGDKVAK